MLGHGCLRRVSIPSFPQIRGKDLFSLYEGIKTGDHGRAVGDPNLSSAYRKPCLPDTLLKKVYLNKSTQLFQSAQ